MKERIEEELTEIVKIYPKSKVFYRPGRPVPNSVTPDISIAEYSKINFQAFSDYMY